MGCEMRGAGAASSLCAEEGEMWRELVECRMRAWACGHGNSPATWTCPCIYNALKERKEKERKEKE